MNSLGASRYFLIGLVIVFLISGCGVLRQKEMARVTPEGLYQSATKDFHRGRYRSAIETFQRLTDEHPLSELAVMAKLGIADAHYSNKEYAEAAQIYNEFVFLNPTNENVPYAMYQVGLCHYHQMGTIDRDQTDTVKAKLQFEALIARFPQSRFARLAEKMLRDCNKRLAEREFYVGWFYFKRKNYKAALGRFEVVAREYPNLGFDYKVKYLTEESKRLLAAEESSKATAPSKKDR